MDRVGWISQPALNYVCKRLTIAPAEAYGVATFYALFSTAPRAPFVAHVCDDICCRLAGAEDICRELERSLGPEGEPALDGAATWLRSPCLGRCEQAPATLFTFAGEQPRAFAEAPLDAAGVISRLEAAAEHTVSSATPSVGEPTSPSTAPTPERLAALRASVPQAGETGLRLLARVGRVDPCSLSDYRASGGYRALERALEMGPATVVEEVLASNLMGRGGAAFPTGRKWAAVAAQTRTPKYIVCNADEAEPGTFKDRVLLEEDPFALVEAMTIAGLATGAETGYLYVRGEYPLARSRMAEAVSAARGAGLLGADVMGAGFTFDIEIRRGGGAYICGEGTALYESIEGKRGEPRNKAERSTAAGLFRSPTAINNVETLANIPLIVLGGGKAFAAIGTPRSTGPKLFALSGHVERPGVYEVDFGVTLRQLIELGGGIPGGRAIRAVLLGGAAGTFLAPDALDVPLTFEATRALDAPLGSGAVMVFDESADLLDTIGRIARFFRDESCGQCVPCRVGTVRQEEVLARLAAGRPRGSTEQELELLRDVGQVMLDASICGLGQTAASAVGSALGLPGVLTR